MHGNFWPPNALHGQEAQDQRRTKHIVELALKAGLSKKFAWSCLIRLSEQTI